MIKTGNLVLRRYADNKLFIVMDATSEHTTAYDFQGSCHKIPLESINDHYASYSCLDEAIGSLPDSVLDIQYGGDHYKKLGKYQPWDVLKAWLTAEEFRGFMKGTAIAYLAREREKGEDLDIEKASHTLQALIEFWRKS